MHVTSFLVPLHLFVARQPAALSLARHIPTVSTIPAPALQPFTCRASHTVPSAILIHAYQIVTRRPAASNEDAFGEAAVSWRHVQRAVRRQLGIELDRSHVMFEGKIEAYGTYKVGWAPYGAAPLRVHTIA